MSVRSEASGTNIFNYMISRQCRLGNLSSNLAGVRHILGYTVLDFDDRPVGDSANRMIKCVVAGVFALVTPEALTVWTKLDPVDSVSLADFWQAIEEENSAPMGRGV